jgi:hypothetical protein
MFFGIIFSLIGLALALVFLPFRLFGGLLSLVLFPVKIILKLLTRNLYVLSVVVIAVFIYLAVKDSKPNLPQLTPATPQASSRGAIPIIQPVQKTEDGDSSFATDLYATMTPEERIAYSSNYYWAMSNLADGKVHTWSAGNINGSLRANDSFANNSGVRCRHFNEVLKVHTVQQTISGTACEQGGGAWCKLKPNATPSCGLGGYSPGLMDIIRRAF